MSNLTNKKVGAFEVRDGALYGPAEYMRDQGDAHLAKILRGEDMLVNLGLSPDVTTAILVSLQTDYAAWRGLREMLATARRVRR